ncbi:MAG: hypothetical protein ACREXY_22195 [Gammaproteobacteria bacterium]
MHHSPRLITCLVLLAAAALLVWAAPASATYVSGKQTFVGGGKKSTYNMAGGLVGSWAITSFKELKNKGVVFKAKGTESFNGCMDLGHDGSCTGDPSGTMDFTFTYWAKISGKGKVELGTCAHPVSAGTGGFASATGFLMFVDTPIKKKPFIKTHYEGEINVAGVLSARAASPPRHC